MRGAWDYLPVNDSPRLYRQLPDGTKRPIDAGAVTVEVLPGERVHIEYPGSPVAIVVVGLPEGAFIRSDRLNKPYI